MADQTAASTENGEKEAVAEINPPTSSPENGADSTDLKTDGNTEMSTREKELLDTVFQLESDKLALIEETRAKIVQIKKEYEECRQENEKLKKKNAIMEQNLVQKEAHPNDPKSTKKDQDDMLMKAKTLLFEKTKVCKQQEQQIAMLKTQVDSIKEVLAVTKEMVNLRNLEIEHFQERMKTNEDCRKAEKERLGLIEKKLEITQEAYKRLRKEYDTQAQIQKELKISYLLKIQLLTDELEKAKGGTIQEVQQ